MAGNSPTNTVDRRTFWSPHRPILSFALFAIGISLNRFLQPPCSMMIGSNNQNQVKINLHRFRKAENLLFCFCFYPSVWHPFLLQPLSFRFRSGSLADSQTFPSRVVAYQHTPLLAFRYNGNRTERDIFYLSNVDIAQQTIFAREKYTQLV